MESTSLYDLEPGATLADRYRIVAPHRQTGLAAAFEAIDEAETGDDQRCEVSLYAHAFFESRDQALQFAASWTPWMRVESNSVLHVREVASLSPTSFLLVTDFPSGATLRDDLAERGRLDGAEVVEIGRQLLGGLVEVHAHGLVHGDVKPSTIYVDRTESVRTTMVDGGVTPGLWSAKQLGEKTALIGTPFYAPIEQFGGDSPNIQSDIYNVATVLFEAVTGVLPWGGKSFLEVFQAKLDKTPPSMQRRAPDAEVDPELEKAIVTGLLADKSQRYATSKEFLERLDALNV